jgi:hypothetical protein
MAVLGYAADGIGELCGGHVSTIRHWPLAVNEVFRFAPWLIVLGRRPAGAFEGNPRIPG